MHARAYLANVLEQMAAADRSGLPFIFLEPSCASVFKDELLEFFPDDERATANERAGLAAGGLACSTRRRIGLPGVWTGRMCWFTGTAITRRCLADQRTRSHC